MDKQKSSRKNKPSPTEAFKIIVEKHNVIEVTLVDAQQRLPELLAAAEAGEDVAIRGPSGRVFHLTVVRPRPPVTGIPKAGSCQGVFVVPKDFKAPLDELREYVE